MSQVSAHVVEKYYSMNELTLLIGFGEKFWRHRCRNGELTLTQGDVVISEPVEIAGELFAPASGVNAYLAQHPYRYDAGVRARNKAELQRKLTRKGELA